MKSNIKARQTIAMMVVISMLLPMVSWASESIPVSAATEKQFLQQFEANQNYILSQIENHTDSDANGEMIWIYVDPKSDVRYMMRQNRDGNFDFFAQTKKFQKKVTQRDGYTRWVFDRSKWTWETKFNGHRIGEVTYVGKKPVLKAELTSKTIDQNLLAAHIPYVSTNGTTYSADGKILLSQEMIQKQLDAERKEKEFSDVANQCTTLVKFDDVRGRGLIRKTFNIERTKQNFSAQQMEEFKDAVHKKYDSKDFNSFVMMYSILNISLNTSLYSMMIFREMFLGPKTQNDLQIYFGQSATFGYETVKNEKYRKAAGRMISTFMEERAKTPVPPMDGPELDAEIETFNGNIQKINELCTGARKRYKNTFASYNGTATLGFMTPKDSLAKYTSDQYFIKVSGVQTESYLKAMRDSKLGILLFSDTFRERVGSFDPKACSQDAIGLTKEPITKSDVMAGVDEVRSAFITQIKDTVEDFSSNDPSEVVGKYLKAFPLTVQKVLNYGKSKEDALLACGIIEDTYSDDYWMDKIDTGIMIGGFAAGFICGITGVGIPASAAILGSFTAADMISGGVKWAEGYTLENAIRGAGISGQTEHVQGQEDLKQAQDLKSQGQWQVALSAAGEVGGYAVGKTIRYVYRTKLAREFFKVQDEKVIGTIKNILEQPKYSSVDKEKFIDVLEKAKVAKDYEEVPAALRNLGLHEEDAKKLSSLIEKSNEEALIYDRLQGIMAQKKYVGKENQTFVILHQVHEQGSVMRVADGIYYNSHERIAALRSARKELIKLGYEPADADKMLNELFNENTGSLRGKYEKAVAGKYGSYSTAHPEITDDLRLNEKGPRISHTARDGADLIKYEYTTPQAFADIKDQFKNGGTIKFKNGKIFLVKGIYNDSGEINTILELENGKLLRVAKRNTMGILDDTPFYYALNQQDLKNRGFPVVEMFDHSHDYVVVEKITNSRNIRNYREYLKVRDQLPELARKIMDEKFIEFAKRTAKIDRIGDFHPGQIVYSDHKGWVLVDFSNDVRWSVADRTVFDAPEFKDYVPEEIYNDAVKAVRDERVSSGLTKSEPNILPAESEVRIIDQFKNGGIIKFKNKKEFLVKGIYNDTGSRSTILELQDGKLLRVLKQKILGNDAPLAFVKNQKILKEHGVPVVEIFEYSDDYVVVQKLTNSRNIEDYAAYLKIRDNLPQPAREKMDRDFVEFAKKTAGLEFIKDFHPKNIVYSDHRGWVLVDFGENIWPYEDGAKTVFDSHFSAGGQVSAVPEKIYNDVVDAIHEARVSSGLTKSEPTITSAESEVRVIDQSSSTTSGSSVGNVVAGIPAASGSSNDVISRAQTLVNKEFGPGYKVLAHDSRWDSILIEKPNGKFQKAYYRESDTQKVVELEGNEFDSLQMDSAYWSKVENRLTKKVIFDENQEFTILTDPYEIKITTSEGSYSIHSDELSPAMFEKALRATSTGSKVKSEGLLVWFDDDLILIDNAGNAMTGMRSGSDMVFTNSKGYKKIFSVTEDPMFDVQSSRWGRAMDWKVVNPRSDPSSFNLPSSADETVPASGYGEINCTAHAFGVDAYLAKSPATCALDDSYFVKTVTGKDKEGILPTKTAKEIESYYGTKAQRFFKPENLQNRLMQMEDGGTAIVIVPPNPPRITTGHMLNARKEGNKIVYYDFQKRVVTDNIEVYYKVSALDRSEKAAYIIETTQFHKNSENVILGEIANKEVSGLTDPGVGYNIGSTSVLDEDVMAEEFVVIDGIDDEIYKLIKTRKTLQEELDKQEAYLASQSDRYNPKFREHLERQIAFVDQSLKPVNDSMIDLTQKYLNKLGIESDLLVDKTGHQQLKLFFTSEHPFYRTIRNYLKEVNYNTNGDILILGDEKLEFIFDPLALNITHAVAAVHKTEVIFGISTLNRILANKLGPDEFHEMIHIYNHIRKQKGIESAFYDQRFYRENGFLLEDSEAYGKFFASEELRAYGDTVWREVLENLSDPEGHLMLRTLRGNIEIPQKIAKSTLVNTRDFYKAVVSGKATFRNGRITHGIEENYRFFRIELPDGRSYVSHFASPEHIRLIDIWKNSQGQRYQELSDDILKLITNNMIDLNHRSYLQVIDYQRLQESIAILQRFDERSGLSLSEGYLNASDQVREKARKVYAHSKETHPEFAWDLEKLDEKNWKFVINEKTQPIGTWSNSIPNLHADLDWLRTRSIMSYPDLNPDAVNKAAEDVQLILNKPEYAKINQNETIEVLEVAHFEGDTHFSNGVMVADYSKKRVLAEARQKLRDLGYSDEDVKIIIDRLADEKVRMLGHAADSNVVKAEKWFESTFDMDIGDINKYFDGTPDYYVLKFHHILDSFEQKDQFITLMNSVHPTKGKPSKYALYEIIRATVDQPEAVAHEYLSKIVKSGIERHAGIFHAQELKGIGRYFNSLNVAMPFDEFVFKIRSNKIENINGVLISGAVHQTTNDRFIMEIVRKSDATMLTDMTDQMISGDPLLGNLIDSMSPNRRASGIHETYYFDLNDVRISSQDADGKNYIIKAKRVSIDTEKEFFESGRGIIEDFDPTNPDHLDKISEDLPKIQYSDNDPVIYFQANDDLEIKMIDDLSVRPLEGPAADAMHSMDEIIAKNDELFDAGKETEFFANLEAMKDLSFVSETERNALKKFVIDSSRKNGSTRRLYSKMKLNNDEWLNIRNKVKNGSIPWNGSDLFGASDQFNLMSVNNPVHVVIDTKYNVRINENNPDRMGFLVHGPDGFEIYKVETINGEKIIYLRDVESFQSGTPWPKL